MSSTGLWKNNTHFFILGVAMHFNICIMVIYPRDILITNKGITK